ncbi:MAG: DNA methyltransferase [Bacteroidales bacterium]|nr:DNA methyltransferase [Bacteroidales bacterium]
MANTNLSAAKNAKNDEFYTRIEDIVTEINAYVEYNPDVFRGKTVLCPCDDPEWSNFTRFFAQRFDSLGLKKLISTSYAYDSKNPKPDFDWQPTLFETENPNFDAIKSPKHGKIFTLTNREEPPRDIQKLQWRYLDGDGDFRSKEVTKLLKEADIVVTNPPFSLFREFMAWIFSEQKQFAVIGNKNAITYKEIFPLIKENKLWIGKTPMSKDLLFDVPESETFKNKKSIGSGYRILDGIVYARAQAVWFTNIEHGRRHNPLTFMTMARNIKGSNHKEIKNIGYKKYDNYDALEVPYTDSIPSDYEGVMGVPISFLDKYCPEQFEILGMCENEDLYGLKTKVYTTEECKNAYFAKFGKKGTYDLNASGVIIENGLYEKVYQRILIRHKK